MNDFTHVRSKVSQQLLYEKEKTGGVLPEGIITAEVVKELSLNKYEVNRDDLIASLEKDFAVLMDNPISLHTDDKSDRPDAPWVAQRETEGTLDFQFWRRYREYLLKDGWAAPVVGKLDYSTNMVLDDLMPPDRPGTWDQRGLMVGSVQSGKTSHYIGLLCKAVDAGYNVIIVLAGIHDNLRTQTQIRIEEGLLGYATQDSDFNYRRATGVGLNCSPVSRNINTVTTRGDNGDFNRSIASHFAIHPGGAPLVFVVKKNVHVLKNLHKWVKDCARIRNSEAIASTPLIMIDDEADHASIDAQRHEFDDPDHDPRSINKWIRRILKAFDQSVYIGYTATPFANIFIHECAATKLEGEDLFPRTFIYNLPAPSNYAGPEKIFGLEYEGQTELPIHIAVSDYADSESLTEQNGWMPPRHDKFHVPLYKGKNELPPSLKSAIRAFILCVAARRVTGQVKAHNSMLIHVTRLTRVQDQIYLQVEEEFQTIQQRLVYGDGGAGSIVEEMKEVWETEFSSKAASYPKDDCSQLEWLAVLQELKSAVRLIKVMVIHGNSIDVLDYSRMAEAGQSLNVIVVGGDKLSRGLTLGGLSISYFLRHSKAYDTLMQMGRWYGYRSGYLGVCRIYCPAELYRWFRHISIASVELRNDLLRMTVSGATPRKFGLRVQTHPTMMITSPLKMTDTAEMYDSFEGLNAKILHFSLKPAAVESNYKAFVELLNRLGPDIKNCSGGVRWKVKDPEPILEFLAGYKEHPATTKARPQYLIDYIRHQLQRDPAMLTDWCIFVSQGSQEEHEFTPVVKTKLVKRSRRNQEEEGDPNHYQIQTLMSGTGFSRDEIVDLSDPEKDLALKKTIEMWEQLGSQGDVPTVPNDVGIRLARPPQKALIGFYPLYVENVDKRPKYPLIGFFISFPADANAKAFPYRVGSVWQRQETEGFWDE